MLFTGREPTAYGPRDNLQCEHCGRKAMRRSDITIPEIKCGKCGKKQKSSQGAVV